MSQATRSFLAVVLILSFVSIQTVPIALAFADEPESAPVETSTESAAVATETTVQESQPANEPESGTKTPPTPDQTETQTQTNSEEIPPESGDQTAPTEETVTQPQSEQSIAEQSVSDTAGSETNEESAALTSSQSATSGGGSAESAQTESTSSESNSSETSSQSAETSSATTSLNATSTGSSTAETHDNLEIQATSSNPTFSINGILDEINDIASSSDSGFVGTSTDSDASTSTSDGFPSSTWTPGGGSTAPIATTSPEQSTSTHDTPSPPIASTTPTVISGSAVAVANILNILNATFLNSQGAILFSNYIDEAGTLDFRNPALFLGLCGLVSCSGDTGIQLNLLNDATIENDIFVNASSGYNDIESNTDAALLSGDAFAALNLVNLANVTFANTNYLIVTLNAFKGILGDLIFPSLEDFFAPILNGQTGGAGSIVGLHNDGTVANDVIAGANSGNNTVQTGENGTSTVLTGNADAHANVFNQINSLLMGSGLSILLRITGTWNGEIENLPDGIAWARTPEGVLLYGTATGTPQGVGALVSGTSTAGINNKVRVGAESGENDITASTTALLATGDAFAAANIVNIANQTIIGRNWLLAVINIFGDFTGNIAFGKPDLWVGAQAQAPGTIKVGDVIDYKITVINNGDAPATFAKLKELPDLSHVRVVQASGDYTLEGGALVWNLGTLAPGKALEVTYRAEVTSFGDSDSIVSNSDATLREADFNAADNHDSTIVRNAISGGGGGGVYVPAANLAPVSPATTTHATTSVAVQKALVTVTRGTPFLHVTEETPVASQVLTVHNTSDIEARDVKLDDIIRGADGVILHEEMFDIGTMAPHEEVTITYDIGFNGAPYGTYSLRSEMMGSNVDPVAQDNGTVVFSAALSIAPELPLREIEHASARIPAPPSEPRIPNAGADAWVASADIYNPESMAAAAGSVDEGVSGSYSKLVTYALLLLSIFGALRLFVFRPV